MFQTKSKATQILSLGLVGLLWLSVGVRATDLQQNIYREVVKAKTRFGYLIRMKQCDDAKPKDSDERYTFLQQLCFRLDYSYDGIQMYIQLKGFVEAMNDVFRMGGLRIKGQSAQAGGSAVLEPHQLKFLKHVYDKIFSKNMFDWLKKNRKIEERTRNYCFALLYKLINLAGNCNMPHSEIDDSKKHMVKFTKWIYEHSLKTLRQKIPEAQELIEISIRLVYASMLDADPMTLGSVEGFTRAAVGKAGLLPETWPRITSRPEFVRALSPLGKWEVVVNQTLYNDAMKKAKGLFGGVSDSKKQDVKNKLRTQQKIRDMVNKLRDIEADAKIFKRIKTDRMQSRGAHTRVRGALLSTATSLGRRPQNLEPVKSHKSLSTSIPKPLSPVEGGRRRCLMERLAAGCPPKRS